MRLNLPPLRRSRHPLTRFVSGLLGLAAAALMLVFGMMAGAVLLFGGVVYFVLRQTSRNPSPPHRATQEPPVIEGEFVVIRQQRPISH